MSITAEVETHTFQICLEVFAFNMPQHMESARSTTTWDNMTKGCTDLVKEIRVTQQPCKRSVIPTVRVKITSIPSLRGRWTLSGTIKWWWTTVFLCPRRRNLKWEMVKEFSETLKPISKRNTRRDSTALVTTGKQKTNMRVRLEVLARSMTNAAHLPWTFTPTPMPKKPRTPLIRQISEKNVLTFKSIA